jgi:hypothetical protein
MPRRHVDIHDDLSGRWAGLQRPIGLVDRLAGEPAGVEAGNDLGPIHQKH